jgi:hypothetical protein
MYHFEDTNEDLPYSLYVSTKVKKKQKAPLIVTLHGLGAPQTIMMSKTAIDLAEEGGYILVAPMGYNISGWYGSPAGGGGGGGRGKGAPGGAKGGAPGALPVVVPKLALLTVRLVRKALRAAARPGVVSAAATSRRTFANSVKRT